jgi:ABC-2 type transport system permease protein
MQTEFAQRYGSLTAAAPAPSSAGTRARHVIFRQTSRKAWRSGLLWGCVFGAYVALQATSYASTYKTQAARDALATSFSGGGLNALVGPAHDLQTVAGYTAWKCLGILAILGAIRGLLLSTNLLRGEEDEGRAELLLAGQVTRRQGVIQTIGGLATSFIALFAAASAVTAIIGHTAKVHWGTGAALFFALAVASGYAMFLAAGALTSQLAANRRQAATYAGGALGLFFVLRMLADSAPPLSWLRWATPFGWIEQLQPFTHPEPAVLLLIGGFTAACSALAVRLAAARDLAGSTLPDRSTANPRTSLLGGPIRLAIRLVRPTVIGWMAGVCALSFLLGSVAKQATKSLAASPSAERALGRLAGQGGEIKGYLGVTYLIVALVLAFVAAGQVTAARHEESSGRLEFLLVRPVSRRRWLLGRLGVATVVVASTGVLSGLFMWMGVASQHVSLGLSSFLGAGLNTVPMAICLLGIGTLAWALVPRSASAAVYAVLAWSFLVELLGGVVNSNRWLLDSSLFRHMNPAPAQAPDWASGMVLIAIGVACVLVGAASFTRRDLAGQ